MRRLTAIAILIAIVSSACSMAPSLSGRFSGDVYAEGYSVGAMAVSVSSSGGSLSGDACFLGINASKACNTLSGSLSPSSITFTIGSLRFSGSWDADHLNTVFTSDDGAVSGHVSFSRYSSAAAIEAHGISPRVSDVSREVLSQVSAPLR